MRCHTTRNTGKNLPHARPDPFLCELASLCDERQNRWRLTILPQSEFERTGWSFRLLGGGSVPEYNVGLDFDVRPWLSDWNRNLAPRMILIRWPILPLWEQEHSLRIPPLSPESVPPAQWSLYGRKRNAACTSSVMLQKLHFIHFKVS